MQIIESANRTRSEYAKGRQHNNNMLRNPAGMGKANTLGSVCILNLYSYVAHFKVKYSIESQGPPDAPEIFKLVTVSHS